MPIAAIAFTPSPPEQNPNIRQKRGSDSAATYYTAMYVTFASIARWNEDISLVLVTDEPIPEAFAANFAKIRVKLLVTPFNHRPPANFFSAFNASLYAVDAINALLDAYPDQKIALIDPDCLAIRPLTNLFAHVNRAIGVFPTNFPPDEISNGLSANQAGELHSRLNPALLGPPEHYGGECYVFDRATMGPVLKRVAPAFALSLDMVDTNEAHFVTEEHLFNYALRGAPLDHLTGLVKRIWTAPVYRNVDGGELSLTLWHLPSEKDRGIKALYKVSADNSSWFWLANPVAFRRLVGKKVGIPRRSARRWLYDALGRRIRRTQGALRR